MSLLATAVVAGGLAVVAQVAGGLGASAAASEPYKWGNVEIQGGGFVPDIIFNEGAKDVVYARTDIGGAYRLDPTTNRWIPMLDWVGSDNWGYNGVSALAADPIDTNSVYVAAGMYTNSWDPNNGAILRSRDKGKTWQEFKLPFKLPGNMPGRGMGERLMVDPNNNKIVYFAASSGKGLWKSTDQGVTFSQVTNFPNVGNYVDDPAYEYSADNQGLTWVAFDAGSSTKGTTTKVIYVGVADKNNPVYRSTDGGATWAAVPGAPTGYLMHKGVVDYVSHTLYTASSDTAGPYNGGKGQVLKFNPTTGTWTDITPEPNSTFGYTGLTIDRQHPGTLMVGTQILWWPDTQFYRTTDGGTTWTKAWDWTSYPNRSFRYKFDVTNAPWVELNPNAVPPDPTTKLGWMNEGIAIDPFNSDRLFYGTGLTLYGTTDLTKWDTAGGQATIKPMAAGLEETAVNDLISPPSGAPLISALGDIGGFTHTDLTKAPDHTFRTPSFTTSTSLDFAEKSPGTIVRAGEFGRSATYQANDKFVAFSTDGGNNWFQAQEPAGSTGGGTVAAAADASRFVLSPNGTGVNYSVGYGNTWTPSTGIPTGAIVESDRVNPMKFYGFSAGTFYTSTDGGASFTAGATGLPTTVKFHAVPGNEGDIWLSGETSGLYHSVDSGKTFTKMPSVTDGRNISLGKAAPGRSYMALYLMGKVDGVAGIFRSDDTGATWVRINDDQHQYGNAGWALSGDPRVFGRVYLGTNGRGVVIGERTGGTVTPPASTPPVTTPPVTTPPVTTPPVTTPPVTTPPVTTPPVTTPPVTTPPVTTPPAPGGCTATYKVANSWPGGFQGDVSIKNNGTTATKGWTVTWTFANGQTISSLWGGILSASGANISVKNETWSGTIAAGGSVSVGFIGAWNGTNAVPTNVSCAAS